MKSILLLKLSGKALFGEPLQTVCKATAQAIAAGYAVVIVHGGGAQLDELASRHGIKTISVAGRRVTDAATLNLAKMAFAANGVDLVAALRATGVSAIPTPAGAAGIVTANRRPPQLVRCDDGCERQIDYGYVGDIISVNTQVLQTLMQNNIVPVISPLAMDDAGQCYNINADTLAAHIAAALNVRELIMVSDVDGIYANPKDPKTRLTQLTKNQLQAFMTTGAASGGMLPKLAAIDKALNLGVKRVRVCNSTAVTGVTLEIVNQGQPGIGTVIV